MLSNVVSFVDMKTMDAWSDNTSIGVAHHSGWLPLLQRLGFLTKAARSSTPRQHVLRLGKLQQTYKVATLSPRLAKKLQQLLDLDRLAIKPPRTWRDWLVALDELLKTFKSCPALTGPLPGYSQLWLARSYMFLLRQGLPRSTLRCDGMSRGDLARMAPDQSHWIEWLCRRRGVAKALQHVSYKGPLELFSMKHCLYANRSLTWSMAHVTQHRSLLKKLLHAYTVQHGIAPHPAVLQRLATHALEENA